MTYNTYGDEVRNAYIFYNDWILIIFYIISTIYNLIDILHEL